MTKEKELKDLLDRLRGELRSSREAGPEEPKAPAPATVESPEKGSAPFPSFRPPRRDAPALARVEFQRIERARLPAGSNIIWSENKETMLFGVMVSLIAVLGGILAGLDYLVLAGTVSFMLFSFVMALTLFGYYLNFRASASGERASARMEEIARKIDSLEERILSGSVASNAVGGGERLKDRELEQKVEELRKIVKSLVRAVDGGGK